MVGFSNNCETFHFQIFLFDPSKATARMLPRSEGVSVIAQVERSTTVIWDVLGV